VKDVLQKAGQMLYTGPDKKTEDATVIINGGNEDKKNQRRRRAIM